MSIIENNNNNSYNQSFISAAAGAGAGYGAWYGSKRLIGKVKSPLIRGGFKNIPQYKDDYLDVAQKIIDDKKLPIKVVSPDKLPQKLKLSKSKKFSESILGKKLERVVNNKYQRTLNAVKKGFNAFFSPDFKVVCVNKEKFISPIFHEIGHSINYYKSNFWSGVQKLRAFSLCAPVVLLGAALLTPKKSEEQKEKQGIIGKIATFTKENAGKLAVLSMLPLLAEELRASQVGNKLAKQYLSGDALKSVLKTNKISALSYSSTVAATGFCVYVANFVRDFVAHKMFNKTN